MAAVVALVGLTYGVIEGGSRGYGDPEIIAAFVAGRRRRRRVPGRPGPRPAPDGAAGPVPGPAGGDLAGRGVRHDGRLLRRGVRAEPVLPAGPRGVTAGDRPAVPADDRAGRDPQPDRRQDRGSGSARGSRSSAGQVLMAAGPARAGRRTGRPAAVGGRRADGAGRCRRLVHGASDHLAAAGRRPAPNGPAPPAAS